MVGVSLVTVASAFMSAAATKIAAIQMAMTDDPSGNLDKAANLTMEAVASGAQIVLLPELFERPYFAIEADSAYYAFAKPLKDNPGIGRFAGIAKAHSAVIIYPFYELAPGGITHYNSAAVIDADGTVLGAYRKSHIPEDDGWFEKFYFAPGDTGFLTWQTRYGVIGVGICWDQWFPETHRLLTLAGAQAIFLPTAIGWGPPPGYFEPWQKGQWMRQQQGQSIANMVPVIAANRRGVEFSPSRPDRNITFWGSSFITDTLGNMLVVGEDDGKDQVVSADVDLKYDDGLVQRAMFFRDRRPDLYAPLLSNTPAKPPVQNPNLAAVYTV